MTLTIDPQPEDDGFPRMMTAALRRRLVARLTDTVAQALGDHVNLGKIQNSSQLSDLIDGFMTLYSERPVRDNSGGSGFNDSLWLYLLATLLAPEQVVESGVHKGHSTWVLRQACPSARIDSFDIDFSRLVYRDPAAHYCQADWRDQPLPAFEAAESLVFFDDHISHAQRICEAHGRGFRLLLLDDNFPAECLYATGGPPVPTLDMILDTDFPADMSLHWRRKGKDYHCTYDKAAAEAAKDLIDQAFVLPDLAPITRLSLGSGLSYVRLKD